MPYRILTNARFINLQLAKSLAQTIRCRLIGVEKNPAVGCWQRCWLLLLLLLLLMLLLLLLLLLMLLLWALLLLLWSVILRRKGWLMVCLVSDWDGGGLGAVHGLRRGRHVRLIQGVIRH